MLRKILKIIHPVLLGIFLACLMEPFVSWFEHKLTDRFPFFQKRERVCRCFAVLSCFFFFLLIFILGIALFSLNLYGYFHNLTLEEFFFKLHRIFEPVLLFFHRMKQGPSTSRYTGMILSAVEGKGKLILQSLIASTLKLPSRIGTFFIGVVFALYLLIDKNFFFSLAKKGADKIISPKRKDQLKQMILEFQKVFFGYLKGQATDAFVMGCLLSFGLWLIGVPLGLSIGILAGIGNLVPYLGPLIAYSLTIFFCLLEQKYQLLWISLIYLFFIQQIDGSYIGPRLLGDKIQLKPIFILLAILCGGTFFGPFGMILAVPFVGWMKSLFRLLFLQKNS